MQRFKNILVVFDRATGSRKALDQAADLARLNRRQAEPRCLSLGI